MIEINIQRKRPRFSAAVLPLLGSNQDSPDPESGVLPVTPRGSGRCAPRLLAICYWLFIELDKPRSLGMSADLSGKANSP